MKRQKEAKLRRNLASSLTIIVLLWLSLASFIYFVDPKITLAIPALFIIVFLALFFTTSTLLINTRRGLILSSALTLFLLLRYFGIGNLLNFLFLAALATTAEYYFWQKR